VVLLYTIILLRDPPATFPSSPCSM
jgi:hypothetical protein